MKMFTVAATALINVSIVTSVGYTAYVYKENEKHIEQRNNQITETLLSIFDKKERYCLTQNIFFEARGESEIGQEAVARVTLNRMTSEKYPDTICGVVWQNKQFSWTHDGKPDKPSQNVLEQKAWEKAEQISQKVLYDYITNQNDITDGAIMYHADYVNPYWTKSFTQVATIDSHIFYK